MRAWCIRARIGTTACTTLDDAQTREDRLHAAQSAAAPGRTAARHRLRLGRARHSRRAAVRRARARRHAEPPAARRSAAPRSPRPASATACAWNCATIAICAARRSTRSSASAWSNTSAASGSATYFRTAYDALRDGGLFLNHGIAQQSRDGKGYRVQRLHGPLRVSRRRSRERRHDAARRRSGRLRNSRRRELARTLRAHAARVVREPRSAPRRRSSPRPTSARTASGRSTWPAARAISGADRWA